MPTYQLLYVSTQALRLTSEDLEDILESSRTNNARLGISGLLVYEGQHFMQILEGEEDAVSTRFELIRQDPRHHDVVVIYRTEVNDWMFESWSMAYLDLQEQDHAARDNFVQIRNLEPGADLNRKDADTARKFIEVFKCMLEPGCN